MDEIATFRPLQSSSPSQVYAGIPLQDFISYIKLSSLIKLQLEKGKQKIRIPQE